MIMIGTITSWHHARGFGFLTPDNGQRDIFLHRKELGGAAPEIGMRVEFELGEFRGRTNATNIKLLGEKATVAAPKFGDAFDDGPGPDVERILSRHGE